MDEIKRFTQKIKNASKRHSPELRLSMTEATCLLQEINNLITQNTELEELLDKQPDEQMPIEINISGETF